MRFGEVHKDKEGGEVITRFQTKNIGLIEFSFSFSFFCSFLVEMYDCIQAQQVNY